MQIKVRKRYLEAENTADEEQHDEDQAHVVESIDLLFVGEVVRLHTSPKNRCSREFISGAAVVRQRRQLWLIDTDM